MQIFINLLSLSRVISGVLIFFVLSQDTISNLIGLVLFIFAGLTDYLDGYLARKHKLVSDLGEILDPISDKILIILVMISLSVYLNSFFMAFCSGVIISREVYVSALRDYSSRIGISSATKVIYLSKVKTTIQFVTITMYFVIISYDLNPLLFLIADILFLITLLITVYTSIIYTLNILNNKL